VIDKLVAHRKSALLFAGIAVLACGIWGTYAWRATRPNPVGNETALSPGGEVAKPTLLRATRPISEIVQKIESERSPAAGDANSSEASIVEGSSGVRANSAPSSLTATEITIARASGQKPAEAPRPAGALVEGKAALARGDFIDGRRMLSLALQRAEPKDADFIRNELTRLSAAMLFSRATNTDDPLTSVHTIGSGDTLHGLAARSKVTEELLASINKVAEANHLYIGQKIKLIRGPFRAVIDKSDHRMDIWLGEIFVRSLPVGLGANGYTPTGEWVVNSKLSNPDWRDPITNRHYLADDPENPIGEHWIGLSGVSGDALGKSGFGIHGTIDPSSIGKDKSMGCVRLRPDDVKLVYDLLVLNESHVVIRD